MPSRPQVRNTRSAISPRLATSRVWIMCPLLSVGLDAPAAPSFLGRRACSTWPRPRAALVPRASLRVSHPEDAVRRRRYRGVGGDGQAHAEDAAGVGGLDDPVVPEPGGGVVGRALRLVLVADRRLERLL